MVNNKKPDIYAVDNDGDTAFHFAAQYGRLKSALRLLIENGVNIDVHDKNGHTALYTADKNGQLEVVQFLIKKYVDNIATSSDDSIDKTLLNYAAKNGLLEVVKKLIKNKADINAANENGQTAFDLATIRTA